MKSIFTILAVLLFSLPLRAVDGKGPLEIDQNNGDSKATRTGCFYSSWQEFSHVASNSLLYLGTGGMAAGALLSYTSERYAKPFIFGSLACLAGGVFFKALGRTVSSVWGINRSQLDKHKTPPTNPQPGGSVTAEIQAVTTVDVESAINPLPIIVCALVEPPLVRASNSTIASDEGENSDHGSETADEWIKVKGQEISTSKGDGYIGNAIKYVTSALSFSVWARKKNTD